MNTLFRYVCAVWKIEPELRKINSKVLRSFFRFIDLFSAEEICTELKMERVMEMEILFVIR